MSEASMPPVDLRPSDWRIVHDLLRRHVPGREVWAFGSRARGTARRHSDLDLVILGDEPLALDSMAALREAFSESDLPWRVDLLDWAETGEDFRRIMARDRVVIQSKSASSTTR